MYLSRYINCLPAYSGTRKRSSRPSCVIFAGRRRKCSNLVQSRRRDVIQRYFGRLFEEGRGAGIIRKDIPSRLMIEILLGVTEAIMNPPKMAELGLTPKAGYRTITTVILEGVLTDKGRPREPRRQGDKEHRDGARSGVR